jgi:hypothetical protein
MTPFQRALIYTAAPLVALSLISTGGIWVAGLYFLWGLAFLAWIFAFGVAISHSIAGKRETAAGVWAGLALGMVALFVSCFANLNLAE